MKDYQALYDADLAIIADATATGFMDAKGVRDGLGWDKPGPNGSYYDSIGVTVRWVRDAGEELVYLLPDGGMYMLGDPPVRKTISKSLRIGVYRDVFERIKAYKEAVYTQRAYDTWHRNCQKAREQGATDEQIKLWFGSPPAMVQDNVLERTSERREQQRAQAEASKQEAYDARRAKILTAVSSCPPDKLNKKGLPRIPWIRRTTGIADVSKADREWALAEIAEESASV